MPYSRQERKYFKTTFNQITMKIYDSTEHFDMEKEKVSEWLQLDVINMWNFSATKHCHKKAFSTTIFYHLKRNVKKDKYVYTSTEVTSLTDEMKTELKNMGYTLLNH
jgi:3-keto-L-gulonate-6-phosphate decarboxylase